MLPILAIGAIIAAVLGVVAYACWKVFNLPADRPAPPSNSVSTELQSEALLSSAAQDNSPRIMAPLNNFTPEDYKLTSRQKVQVGIRAFNLIRGSGMVGMAVRRTFNRPQMTGGDADLGWKEGSLTRNLNEPPVLNVNVLSSGRIEMEGRAVRFDELSARLGEIQSVGGKVRYFQEQADPEPREAAEVMNFILDSGLPVVIAGSASTASPNHPS